MNASLRPFAARPAAAPKRHLTARRRDGLTTALLAALLLAALAFAAVSLVDLWRARAANDAIRALAAGEDVGIAEDAPARLLVARGRFLLDRDRIEAAEALVPALAATLDGQAIADFAHDLGNARLRTAFRLIEDNDITGATPVVRLAQEDYSQALRLDPARWDSKVNLDIASRLVRTFPRPAQEEQPGERPRNVWTDMPGLPRGLP